MKKIYVILVAMVLCNTAISQVVFLEDFTSGGIPAGFTLYNDSNTVAPNIAALFPDAWAVIMEPADTTNLAAASPSWFTAAVQADRWMITPSITVGANNALTWRGKSQDPAFPDGYSVKISTTGFAKTDFTIPVIDIPADSSYWTNRMFDLSAYDGQTIYIAFIQNTTDMFYILVDDIKVGVLTGIEENSSADVKVQLTPNPASDYMKVFASDMIQTIKVMNSVGQVVIEEVVNANETTLNVSTLNSGIYFVKGTTVDGKSFTEKVIVR